MFIYKLDFGNLPTTDKAKFIRFKGNLNRWEFDGASAVSNDMRQVICFYDSEKNQKLVILENILVCYGVQFERVKIDPKDLFAMAKRYEEIKTRG